MRLNGALKPRQGASKQGSSPGVVFKGYRVKRYFKVNKNVVNGQPLDARGPKNNKNNVINSNYNSINNQQRAITSLSLRLERKGKCGEALSKSLSRIHSSTSIRIIKQIDFLTDYNITQPRVSAVGTTEACDNYLNKRRSKYNFLQKTTATATVALAVAVTVAKAAATAETDTVKEKHSKRKINIPIDSDPKAVINITARQIEDTAVKTESGENKNNYSTSVGRKNNKGRNNINTDNRKQVKEFLFVPKMNANSDLKAIILQLCVELKLMFFVIFLHAIRHFNVKLFTHSADSRRDAANVCSTAIGGYRLGLRPVGYNFTKMMAASQLIVSLLKSIRLKNVKGTQSPVALFMVIYAATAILLPHAVVGDDGDSFFPINGIETTTPEFDYASRGQKKFGDKCENTLECGFPGSICDPKKKSCQCTEDLPVTNHIDKCGKEAAVNESCFFNEQCEVKYFQTECRDQRCVCRFDMTPIWMKDGSVECKGRGDKKGPETYVDPAMIGVLIGMALMFIIICVVLRLFSQARWRENRTIFNTPNPRLMNVSLLRESKLLHGQERRGSRMSVRAPSRQPSMASLRPHSPNPSLGKTGRMTRSKSNTRSSEPRVSDVSNCSRLLEHHAANTHHAAHSHTNAISPHSSSTNQGAQTSVSPISLNAPTTIITNASETPVAETTDCSTNLPTTKTKF